jgi:hypothetical protein
LTPATVLRETPMRRKKSRRSQQSDYAVDLLAKIKGYMVADAIGVTHYGLAEGALGLASSGPP